MQVEVEKLISNFDFKETRNFLTVLVRHYKMSLVWSCYVNSFCKILDNGNIPLKLISVRRKLWKSVMLMYCGVY